MDTTESTPFSQQDSRQPNESREQFSDEEVTHAIETQLALWAQRAGSRHPTVMRQSFAHHLMQQLTANSLEALATTAVRYQLDLVAEDDLQRYSAEQAQQSYRTRQVLMSVAMNGQRDDASVRDPYFHELFETARHFQTNPNTPTTYGSALQVLLRLYLQYEQANKPHESHHQTVEQEYFVVIINKLVEELHDHTV